MTTEDKIIEEKTIDFTIDKFIDIEYCNDDVDTDRGTLRDKSFVLIFKDTKNNQIQLSLSEDEFFNLQDKLNQFESIDNRE